MELDASALRQLKGEQFERLLQDLLRLEAQLVGVPASAEGLSFRTDGQGDGGVDALVASPPERPSARIPGRWVFQVKTSLDLPKLKRELRSRSNARVRKLLRDGAGYTLIVNAHSEPEVVLPKLKALLKEVVQAKVKCSVVTREHVATWLAECPQLWSRVPHLAKAAGHLRQFAQWEEQCGVERLPWTPDDERTSAARRIAQLRQGEVLRLIGPPGVGKTRLALESLRARAREVCYLPAHVDSVEDLLARDTPLRGVLVIDECSNTQHERLSRLRANDLTLITIGVDEDDDRSLRRPPGVLLLHRLDMASMDELAQRASGAIDAGVRRELARLSAGYPKYLDLLLQAIGVCPQQLSFQYSELHQLTKRFLKPVGSAIELSALAVAKWVDLSVGSTDLEVLAATVASSEQNLRRVFEGLFKRGLAGRRDNLWYVSPPILAEQLAVDFWGLDAPERFQKLIRDGAEHDLIERCVQRFEDGHADLREVFFQLARDRAITTEHLTRAQRGRFLKRLASRDPFGALEFARRERSLPWSDFGEALALIARDGRCFPAALELLVSSFLEAPEGARPAPLVDLFPSQHAQTLASVDSRASAVERLASSADVTRRQLSGDLARVGCTRNVQSFTDDFESPVHPHRDELAYRGRMVDVLCRLMGDPVDSIRQRVVSYVPELVARQVEHFDSLAVRLVEAMVEHGHALDAVRKRLEWVTEREWKGEGAVPVNQLKGLLAARTLKEKFQEILGRRAWFSLDRSQLHVLVSEWVKAPTGDVLAFLSESGPGRRPAGMALAAFDPERRLLGSIEEALAHEGRHPGFAQGYLEGWSQYDATLDRWARSPQLSSAVLLLTAQRPLDARSVERLRLAVSHGNLGPRWPEVLHNYFEAPPDLRARLRPLFELNPPSWLHLVASRAAADPTDATLDELEAAWAAVEPSAGFNSDWESAAGTLSQRRSAFVRRFILAQLRERRRLDPRWTHFAHAFLTPWCDFAAVLDALSAEERMRVAWNLRGTAPNAEAPAIIEWIGRDETRLSLVAMMARPAEDRPDNLAAALLDAWPTNSRLAQTIHDNFKLRGAYLGVYDGSTDARERELSQLRALAQSSRRGLAMWARAATVEQERLIDEGRARDESHRLGMQWSRQPGEKISQAIYRLAEAQSGYFTAAQAADVGCSAQLLQNYRKARKVERVQRSIYRLKQFPPSEHEDLVVVWLWSGGIGVFSHATALTLHGLSSVIAERHELTLPLRHERRRLRLPENVRLHFADVPVRDRVSVGPLVVTSVERTLADCERDGLGPELVREAREDARRKGLLA